MYTNHKINNHNCEEKTIINHHKSKVFFYNLCMSVYGNEIKRR